MRRLCVLDNGIRVMAHPMNHMESVAIGIWVRAGGRYENEKNSGISHLLEHLLFKGTKNRDMTNIKHEIEGRGGSFNGFTSEEHTCYLVKVLGKDAGLGIDILSDMVFNPKLDSDEIIKEKNVVIEEINMYKDIPSHYVHEILAEEMWPGQPLGMPLAGTIDSVKAVSREDIVLYKEKYYNPKNIFMIAAGNISSEELSALAKKYMSHAVPVVESAYSKANISQDRPRLKVFFKETEQTHVALGLHTLDRYHKDKHVLSLINIMLGANMSSRLFHIVRDEMGLCYEISSSVRRFEDCGAMVVNIGVEDKKLIKALNVTLREFKRFTEEAVTENELSRAREYYKGQLLFALEDTMSHMLWLGEKVVAGEELLEPRAILERVDKVTSEDIMRVAKDLFIEKNLNLAVIGPIKNDDEIKGVLHF